jgi:hypothetical protein
MCCRPERGSSARRNSPHRHFAAERRRLSAWLPRTRGTRSATGSRRSDGTTPKETQHKVEEVVREIGNQLGHVLEAMDDTVRDDEARRDLKTAFNALGSAISSTVEDAATAIRGAKGDEPPRPD